MIVSDYFPRIGPRLDRYQIRSDLTKYTNGDHIREIVEQICSQQNSRFDDNGHLTGVLIRSLVLAERMN